jgi:VWFA-related protein
LASDAFRVKEDGRSVSPSSVGVAGVEETREPIQIALAIDVSSSMRGQAINHAKEAAAQFVEHLSPGDKVGLFRFNEEVKKVQEFTDNKDVLKEWISRLQAGGGTALYEAIYQAAEAVGEREGRRAFVLVTDGWNDTELSRTLDEAAEQARASQVPGYVLGFGSAYDDALTKIAEETGGRYLREPSSADLSTLFSELTGLLQSQYVITYESQVPLNELSHDLDIEADVGMPTEFVVPGNDPLAAAIDVARTVVRRAERRAVAHLSSDSPSLVVPYLNRLADYLYMVARAVEREWTPTRGEST